MHKPIFRQFTPILLLIFLFVIASGCKSNNTEQASIPTPQADIAALNLEPSTFNIPITYSISSLEDFLNHKLEGDFLETIIRPENKNKLEIGLKLSRTNKIKLSSNGKEMTCLVPLKAIATIQNSSLNILTQGLKPVESELILELQTPVTLDNLWNLVTKFDLVNTTWIEVPKLKVLGINFDLQKSVDNLLTEESESLTRLLDDEINKGVSLAPAVGKVWDDIQNPIAVSKIEPYFYLQFSCDRISGKFILGDTTIKCMTSIRAKVGLSTDTTESNSKRKKLPPFLTNNELDSLSDVYLHLLVSFGEVNKELNDQLVGHTFTADGLSLTIRDVKVSGSNLGMTIKLKATGAVNGELIATARPFFDSTNQKLLFNEFDFKVVSNNALLQLADVFLHNMIRDSIEHGLGLELNAILSEIPLIINQAIAKGKVGNTIDLMLNDMRIASCDVVMDEQNIHLNVHTYFLAGIELKYINPGKSLHIRPKEESQTPDKGR